MSIQALSVKGVGYKIKPDEQVFSHISDSDIEYDFIDILGLDGGYYDMKNLESDKNKSPLRVFIDGMNGDYKYILYVTEVHYIENTHGDNFWKNKYRDDDFLRKYAQRHIELVTGKKMGTLQEVEFEHYQ